MEVKQQSKLTLTTVDIVNLSFVAQKPNDGLGEINLQIVPKVFFPPDHPDSFGIHFDVALDYPDFFNLSLTAVGGFILESGLSEIEKKSFINMNAPAIMFPYVRSFIATLTANMGKSTSALTIPPHFFGGDLEVISPNEVL